MAPHKIKIPLPGDFSYLPLSRPPTLCITRATEDTLRRPHKTGWPATRSSEGAKGGAADRDRTGDLLLGKETFYH